MSHTKHHTSHKKQNKRKKIRRYILLISVVLLLAAYLVLPGFLPLSAIFVEDYSVSDDGSAITLTVANASSMGFVRTLHAKEDSGTLNLTPIAAFGSINGRILACNTFTFPLSEDTTIIAFYRGKDCFETTLLQDETGAWVRKQAPQLE